MTYMSAEICRCPIYQSWILTYHKVKRLHRLSIPHLKFLCLRCPSPKTSGGIARHWTRGQTGWYDKTVFCFGHTSFLTPHRTQKRNTDRGFSNSAFWSRKKWMAIPEETSHPTTVTMATDSGSNALHWSSARADMGRQGTGQERLAGLVHSANLRYSGRTWTFVEFARL